MSGGGPGGVPVRGVFLACNLLGLLSGVEKTDQTVTQRSKKGSGKGSGEGFSEPCKP